MKSVLHSDGFEGMGSIVEVVVVYTEKDVQHDIRKDFDFSILRVYGEVNLIEGPCRAKVESMSRSSLYQKEDE